MAGARPKPFLTAEWRDLAMLNYEIDPTVLVPLVPAGTELDSWNGRTFVSVVAFRFLGTRIRGLPIPFHRNFEELNLRFYVRRNAGGEWRRGVGTVEYEVEHPRWSVARATKASLDCDVAAFYGPAFAPFLSGEPSSAFLAKGSEIVVRHGVRI